MHRRHGEPRERLEDLADPLHVRGFLSEVQLSLERVRQVLEDGLHVDDELQTRAFRCLLREDLQQREVLLDQLARIGSLDLDHDLLSRRERRPVDLRDRAGRERLRFDRLEDVLPGHAELLLHHRDDLRLAERRHVVLQSRELFDELGREQVRPRREDLTELAERGTELLERGAESFRLASPAHDALLVGPAEELPQAVLGEDDADLRAAGDQMRPGHRFRVR